MLRLLSLFLLLATTSIPAYSQVFGSLANFDVVNDTGKTAHGFEIEIHDINKSNITSIFGDATRWPNMERYGVPTVTEFSDASGVGVRIRYQGNYNGGWTVGTPSGTLPVNPSDSCWPYGAPTYGPDYPCDHFGVSTNVGTPNVKYSWLVETAQGSSSLIPIEATVPNPVFTVTPVPPVNNVPQPPQVNVAIVAPKPNLYEFGEARWVKVTATGTLENVAVEDLVAENAVIKKAKTQTQIEWQLLQVDAGNPGSGQIDLTGVQLDQGAKGVVYRFEFYEYTGYHDPGTYEAKLHSGSDTPAQPDPFDLGQFLVAQNAGVNFDGQVPAAPPLPNAPAINATIIGAIVGQPYNQVVDVTPGNAGDIITIDITGLPPGLSVDAVTNAIVGTPTQAGTFPIVIVATDISNGLSTTASTNIDVAYEPVLFNVTFPNATATLAYNYQFTAIGNGAITYTIAGTLPDGLNLSGDTLTGIPNVDGSFPLTIKAEDAQGFYQTVTATLVIDPAPVGPPPPPPTPVACSGANEVITNFSPRGQWIETLGGIQNGGKAINFPGQDATTIVPPLTAATAFNPGNLATYSGTMDQANVFCVAETITLSQGLAFAPLVLPNGQEGVAYTTVAISPTGGVQPYTIVVSDLPNGMTFNGIEITGTPLIAGPYTVGISIDDNNGQRVFYNANLIIDPAPAIPVVISGALGSGQVGVPYAGSLTATGGNGALNWSVTGAIPGVNFANGVFSGTPTTSGTYPLVVTAADAHGSSTTASYNVTIANPVVPPASCTKPANAKSFSVGKSKITAVTATTITVGGKVVETRCATVSWNGAKAFKVGDYAEVSKGFTANGINTATKITIN